MANLSQSHGDPIPGAGTPGGASKFLERIARFLKSKQIDPTLRESLEDILGADDSTVQELRDEERVMLMNVLGLDGVRVDDVMVPRADIIAVDAGSTVVECGRVFAEAAHSRLPAYRETLDDPVGMVHIKDLIGLLLPNDAAKTDESDPLRMPIATLVRPLLFVPPSMPVVDLFVKMQTTRQHMALVIDEYGGTDGLVTIEDLVEEIVGDIEDEHDTDLPPRLKRRSDGGFDADARVAIADLEAAIEVDLIPDDRDEDIETLGGLVFTLLGRVPDRGEIVHHAAGLRIEVIDADPRRIKRLRVYPEATRRSSADETKPSAAAKSDTEKTAPPKTETPKAETSKAETPTST